MSQLSQHNDGFDSQLQFFPQDSPTIGRNQVYNSPNTSSPISEPGKRYAKVYLELEHFTAFRVLTRDPSKISTQGCSQSFTNEYDCYFSADERDSDENYVSTGWYRSYFDINEL
jgi:hypothetical protein